MPKTTYIREDQPFTIGAEVLENQKIQNIDKAKKLEKTEIDQFDTKFNFNYNYYKIPIFGFDTELYEIRRDYIYNLNNSTIYLTHGQPSISNSLNMSIYDNDIYTTYISCIKNSELDTFYNNIKWDVSFYRNNPTYLSASNNNISNLVPIRWNGMSLDSNTNIVGNVKVAKSLEIYNNIGYLNYSSSANNDNQYFNYLFSKNSDYNYIIGFDSSPLCDWPYKNYLEKSCFYNGYIKSKQDYLLNSFYYTVFYYANSNNYNVNYYYNNIFEILSKNTACNFGDVPGTIGLNIINDINFSFLNTHQLLYEFEYVLDSSSSAIISPFFTLSTSNEGYATCINTEFNSLKPLYHNYILQRYTTPFIFKTRDISTEFEINDNYFKNNTVLFNANKNFFDVIITGSMSCLGFTEAQRQYTLGKTINMFTNVDYLPCYNDKYQNRFNGGIIYNHQISQNTIPQYMLTNTSGSTSLNWTASTNIDETVILSASAILRSSTYTGTNVTLSECLSDPSNTIGKEFIRKSYFEYEFSIPSICSTQNHLLEFGIFLQATFQGYQDKYCIRYNTYKPDYSSICTIYNNYTGNGYLYRDIIYANINNEDTKIISINNIYVPLLRINTDGYISIPKYIDENNQLIFEKTKDKIDPKIIEFQLDTETNKYKHISYDTNLKPTKIKFFLDLDKMTYEFIIVNDANKNYNLYRKYDIYKLPDLNLDFSATGVTDPHPIYRRKINYIQILTPFIGFSPLEPQQANYPEMIAIKLISSKFYTYKEQFVGLYTGSTNAQQKFVNSLFTMNPSDFVYQHKINEEFHKTLFSPMQTRMIKGITVGISNNENDDAAIITDYACGATNLEFVEKVYNAM